MPESVKSQRLLDAQQHLDLAKLQRQHYNDQCAATKKSEADCPPRVMHYSFTIRSMLNSLAPSFLKPHENAVFSVYLVKPRPVRLNYLIDEADDVGKGANATISLVHHYLPNYGLKEKHLQLHANNCVRQIRIIL